LRSCTQPGVTNSLARCSFFFRIRSDCAGSGTTCGYLTLAYLFIAGTSYPVGYVDGFASAVHTSIGFNAFRWGLLGTTRGPIFHIGLNTGALFTGKGCALIGSLTTVFIGFTLILLLTVWIGRTVSFAALSTLAGGDIKGRSRNDIVPGSGALRALFTGSSILDLIGSRYKSRYIIVSTTHHKEYQEKYH